jgi:hypothetical protein
MPILVVLAVFCGQLHLMQKQSLQNQQPQQTISSICGKLLAKVFYGLEIQLKGC